MEIYICSWDLGGSEMNRYKMDRELNLMDICQVNRKIIQNEEINFCLFWLRTLNIYECGIKKCSVCTWVIAGVHGLAG